jgi:hypothetical protein
MSHSSLNLDVINLLMEDITLKLLMSVTCRSYSLHTDRTSELANTVVARCNIEVIDKLRPSNLLRRAARVGRFELLQRLGYRPTLCGRVCVTAASNGRVEIVKWCCEETEFKWDERIYTKPALNGHLNVLQYIRAEGHPLVKAMCGAAATGGHLDILEWLFANGCPRGKSTCAGAALGGHLEILKWLVKNGCPWDGRTCENAVRGGHLHILEWTHANGWPWSNSITNRAAAEGQLTILQWCRANGCPWDEWVCGLAAREGHLELLQWARANGCPWDEFTCNEAAANGQLDELIWALANGCPFNLEDCLRLAYMHRQSHVIEWLRSHY